MRFLSLFITIFALTTTFASAENWPSWRGPNHSGSTVSGKYPADLTDPANLTWKLPLAGKGCSTPIVWENQIFITGPKDGQDTVNAISWEGKILWEKSIGKERGGNFLEETFTLKIWILTR